MRCPVCRVTRLVEIDITVQGGPLRMHACSTCDTRWWDREGERLPLEQVLELATVRRERAPSAAGR